MNIPQSNASEEVWSNYFKHGSRKDELRDLNKFIQYHRDHFIKFKMQFNEYYGMEIDGYIKNGCHSLIAARTLVHDIQSLMNGRCVADDSGRFIQFN